MEQKRNILVQCVPLSPKVGKQVVRARLSLSLLISSLSWLQLRVLLLFPYEKVFNRSLQQDHAIFKWGRVLSCWAPLLLLLQLHQICRTNYSVHSNLLSHRTRPRAAMICTLFCAYTFEKKRYPVERLYYFFILHFAVCLKFPATQAVAYHSVTVWYNLYMFTSVINL